MKRKLQALVVRSAYSAINLALRIAAFIRWPRSRPAAAKRVCVFRIGHIGDIVCALPAINAIRHAYPDAHLTLLTSPGQRSMAGAAEVLADAKWIDELRVYHAGDIDTFAKRWSLAKELRARRFDVWIDLPNDLSTIARQFRDMLFASLVGPRWARGWRIDTLKWAAQAQSEHLHFSNEVERMLAVVRRSGMDAVDAEFALPRTAETKDRIDALMRSWNLQSDRLIAIAPGAKRSTNLWVPDRFAEVGRALASQGYRIVLVAGKADSDTCGTIAEQIGPRAYSFAGMLSVSESTELLRRCRLVVCLDSGIQHLASAVGTLCVSLFSFWQMRGKWHPYGPRNVVLQKWVPCHTCLLEACPNGNRCMNAIEVKEVVESAMEMLHIDKGHVPAGISLRESFPAAPAGNV